MSDLSNKECYFCKKNEHIQMVCKEMKENLKRIRNLRDGRRKDGENSEDGALGFVDDEDDYDGAFLIDGGVVHG